MNVPYKNVLLLDKYLNGFQSFIPTKEDKTVMDILVTKYSPNMYLK